MTIQVAYSEKPQPQSAVSEISSQLSSSKPVAVFFFASPIFSPDEISSAMKNAFPEATVVGCSTAGEIVTGKMLKNSIVAMALESDEIEGIASDVIDLSDRKSPAKVAIDLAAKFGEKPMDLDVEKYIGMILIDGLSLGEEKVMERLGDILNITIIGGSAGDNLEFQKTWVYLEGKAYTNAAILTLIKPGCKFDIIKTQSFNRTEKILVPTSVDQEARGVHEFNGKPATEEYAAALGLPEDEISTRFMVNPVGLISGDEPFVRAPYRVEGKSIFFHCQVQKDIELELLTPIDIVEDTRRAILAMEEKVGAIKGLINFNCSERTCLLTQAQKCDEYGALFSDFPTVGFSTYGEELIGHMNNTATMLLFY